MQKRLMDSSKISVMNELSFMAIDVENDLLAVGAIAGKDYTLLDCFKLAVELEKAKEIRCFGNKMELIASEIGRMTNLIERNPIYVDVSGELEVTNSGELEVTGDF